MKSIFAHIGAGLLASAAWVAQAGAQDPTTPADHSGNSEIARYCGALAPSASEARAAYQLRRLADLERQVHEEVDKLDKKEAAARAWVTKREDMMKGATEDVVAIYGKMPTDAAAAQLAAMDELIAAAVLSKLNPRAAGDILGEMVPDKAAKLSTILAGALSADKS